MTLRLEAYAVSGTVLILAYCALNAFKSVYEGYILVQLSPAFLAVNVFVLAQVAYIVLQRDRRELFAKSARHLGAVLGINLTTALSWFAVLYALNFLPPAAVNSLVVGLIPALGLILAPALRRGAPVFRSDLTAAAGCFGASVLLVYVILQGGSGLQQLSVMEIGLGTLAAALTALGVAGNTYATRALSDTGFSSSQIMCVRFTLLNVVAFCLTTGQGEWGSYTLDAVLAILFLAVIGVFVGIYLLQVGISRTSPIMASLLFTSNLGFTYVAQYLDPRLSPSWQVLGCALLVTVFTVYGVYGRWQAERVLKVQQAGAE